MWKSADVWANPSLVLATAYERRDVVEGLVPDQGVTWMYGASMSFKTFVAMSIASAASRGADWLGRETEQSLVVYVGAEGGLSLHARRAGVEVAAGEAGDLCVAVERPQLDTALGQVQLRGILQGLTGNAFGEPEYDVEEDVVFEGARQKYTPSAKWSFEDVLSVLVIIDTYSQTSAGDDRTNVAAYIKGLRDMIEDAQEASQLRLSFIVIDHATKAGGSYSGSVAKINDVDSQIEVVRDGQTLRSTLVHRKVKDGVESAPVPLEMAQVELGYQDAYGRPITTLVVEDGAKAAKLASVAEGKAGLLLRILHDEGGKRDEDTLRRLFRDHPENAGVKGESVARAYKRAVAGLVGLIEVDGGVVRTT